jgi:hypothetical protein
MEGQGGFRVENLVLIFTVNTGVLFLCLSSDLFSHTTMIVFLFSNLDLAKFDYRLVRNVERLGILLLHVDDMLELLSK